MRASRGHHLHAHRPGLPVARRRAAGQGRRRRVPGGGHPGRGRARPPARSASSSDQHEQRLAGQRLAVERAEFEADRAQRQFDACEPENRLVARTLEARARGQRSPTVERERRQARRARARPARAAHRQPSARRSLGSRATSRGCGTQTTTTDRDRKELLRTLISEVIVTVNERPAPRRRRDLLGRRRSHRADRAAQRAAAPERDRHREDTVELIRRLAAHHPDQQIAAILNSQGRRTGTGLPFTEARVRDARQTRRHPRRATTRPRQRPGHDRAGRDRARRLARSRSAAGCSDGLLPGEQTTPHAPWRIRLTDEIRARFVPDVPDGYLPLDRGRQARSAAPARPCCTRSNAASCDADPSHQRTAKRPQNQGSRRAAWTV